MLRRSKQLQEYKVVVELPVLWGQMDAFEHVNNTVYFRYFESARMVYGDKIDMYKFLREDGIGPILAATSCTFIKPLRYPDTIHVGCRTIRITESEMDQEYAIYSERLKKLAASGTATIVAYDYNEFKKSKFPQALVESILSLEKNLKLS
ncbi:MAG: acyl-CoA thioesterase [Desulfoferrobacter sp.]